MFVLVHGAWHGSWCWERLEPRLRALGHDVVTMDLPVEDGGATFLTYRDAVLAAWPDEPGRSIVLVGHSLGGMVIPLVIACRPVQAAVFLCPVVPNVDGMPWDQAPEMGAADAYATVTRRDGAVYFDSRDEAVTTFYGMCTPRDAAWAFDRLRAQNSSSLWDRPYPLQQLPPGRRFVIAGQHDRAITPAFLHAVSVRRLGTEPIVLDSNHSPFLSATSTLTDVLDRISHPIP
ncbi:MAG TPA: alpha/beta hydrolase [Nocardioides sp.]|uniref:alpha/beta hydrolase n=1 Tax=Nocardioides sp. TaxID=35761 RepID=UPI002F3E7580